MNDNSEMLLTARIPLAERPQMKPERLPNKAK